MKLLGAVPIVPVSGKDTKVKPFLIVSSVTKTPFEMVAVEIIELTQKSAEGRYFIFVPEESFKFREMNWGLAVKIVKSEQLFLGMEKSSKDSNPVLVEVIGKFSITFTRYKLILITMVRNEK